MKTLLGVPPTLSNLRRALADLHREGTQDMKTEGFSRRNTRVMDFLDVRYRGQSYELTVPFSSDWAGAFHRRHERRYGHHSPKSPLEVVSVRSTLLGTTDKPRLPLTRRVAGSPSPVESTRVWSDRWVEASVYDRGRLRHGHRFKGPAIVGEYSATTFVPEEWECAVDRFGNLILRLTRDK